MFIGSLIASRFLCLIAHFVVTVIIFLSKVGGEINVESSTYVHLFWKTDKVISLICNAMSDLKLNYSCGSYYFQELFHDRKCTVMRSKYK